MKREEEREREREVKVGGVGGEELEQVEKR